MDWRDESLPYDERRHLYYASREWSVLKRLVHERPRPGRVQQRRGTDLHSRSGTAQEDQSVQCLTT